jgi:hypothetical protein
MKKFSVGKKWFMVGSIITLATACQSKPVRQPIQSSHIDLEQDDEEEGNESYWDQIEPFKIEEKQLKIVNAPQEPVKESHQEPVGESHQVTVGSAGLKEDQQQVTVGPNEPQPPVQTAAQLSPSVAEPESSAIPACTNIVAVPMPEINPHSAITDAPTALGETTENFSGTESCSPLAP